ncbi:flagellar export protein FliJ [Bordetella sp. FB-8]|uniref:flagellar export protein FliJ n=1 Tax=Bordetella sp. FB-8 TaxID=1159870 RepID=UPI000381C823|nr:flagellar export protein FliJ [Bordetella sp. FB-8]
MPSHLPLDTLIELAKEHADTAARALGRLNQERQHAEKQLELLRDYRNDYLTRLQKIMLSGMTASDCHNYQRFITTLDDAISQQVVSLEALNVNLEKSRLHWQHQQRKLNAFDTLAQREAQAARVVTERHEQRINDEHSTRLAGRRHSFY